MILVHVIHIIYCIQETYVHPFRMHTREIDRRLNSNILRQKREIERVLEISRRTPNRT
jgi:hypothetical protein